MKSDKIKIIDDIASQIRSILGISEDAFEIQDIIQRLNGTITLNPFCDSEALVIKRSNDTFEIQLNDNINIKRMRFSIAHELGHLFLHMKYLIDPDVWNSIENGTRHARATNIPYTVEEFEANEFAAAFLMPQRRFIEVAEQTSDGSYYYPEKISTKFNVSTQSVEVRGRILGLWE